MSTEFLVTSRKDMEERGWDQLDFVYVNGDAYVDHPGFAAALIGRMLEARGYRVGLISQPDWHDVEAFKVLGKPRLGILPMGTGNLLARNLYIPVSDVAACVNIALNGAGQAVDAIEMTTTSAPGEETEHTFFVMSGAGFDALVMNDTNEEIKAKFGWVAYVQSGMKHMLGRSHPVRISVDGGEPRTLPMRSVLIANCGRLQGGIRLADMTDVNDGNLEVIVASPRDLVEWGLLMAKVTRRTILGSPRIELPVIRHLVGSEVVLEFPDGAQPVEVDGDPAPSAYRISARVLPAAVEVAVHPEVL